MSPLHSVTLPTAFSRYVFICLHTSNASCDIFGALCIWASSDCTWSGLILLFTLMLLGWLSQHLQIHIWLCSVPRRQSPGPPSTKTVSRSSAEAEYRAVANAVAEVSWLRQLLAELHVPVSRAALVYCNNISTVYMSANPVQHQRTKHVEINLHFVWERVATGAVCVLHVPTSSQYADIFTKGLPSSVFTEFRSSLNIQAADDQTAGGWGC